MVAVRLRRQKRLEAAIRELIAGAALLPGSRALDYGCADAHYRDTPTEGVEYVGADLPGNPWATVALAAGGTLPLPDDSFDLVLSTQVLEHVEEPVTYLAECFRVLTPGGSLVLSTHGLMYYHRDPEDYWRWTYDGLTRIVTQAGFAVAEGRGLLGLTATALQTLSGRRRQPGPAAAAQTLRPGYASADCAGRPLLHGRVAAGQRSRAGSAGRQTDIRAR